MKWFLFLFILKPALAGHNGLEVTVHKLNENGDYNLGFNGHQFKLNPDCKEELRYKGLNFHTYHCHTHCLLIGTSGGRCKKINEKEAQETCKCDDRPGNYGDPSYQRKIQSEKKQKSIRENKKNTKKKYNNDYKNIKTTNNGKNPYQNQNENQTTEPNPKSTKRGVSKNEKTKKNRINKEKQIKTIPGTNILELIDSNEKKMDDPPYNSDESIEK